MGSIFGGSGKKQAKAIKESSELEAKQAREAARGDTLAMQTMLAQDKAAKAAEELLKRPQGEVEVDLESTDGDHDTFDPATGKRRTKRASYSAASAGISI